MKKGVQNRTWNLRCSEDKRSWIDLEKVELPVFRNPDEAKEHLEKRVFTKQAGSSGSGCQKGECSNR